MHACHAMFKATPSRSNPIAVTRNAEMELHLMPDSSWASSSSPSTALNTGPDTSHTCIIWWTNHPEHRKSCKQATLQSQRMTDHACEHLNKLIKIHSGLVGISLAMLGRGSSSSHQYYPVLHKSSRVSLTWNLTKQESTMTLGQVLSRRSMTLSTRSRQPYWNMETHLLLKVTSCTIWSLTPTSLM